MGAAKYSTILRSPKMEYSGEKNIYQNHNYIMAAQANSEQGGATGAEYPAMNIDNTSTPIYLGIHFIT